MSDDEVDIGDIEPDDVDTDGDDEVDWSQVDKVQTQIDEINAIEDEDERTTAAAEWADKLAGDSVGE